MKKITLLMMIMIGFNACKSDEPVLADFDLQETTNGEVIFTNKSSGATSYEWDFGGGKTSTETSPRFTFSDNKDYTVSLSAKGKSGQNQKSKSLKVITYDRNLFITNKTYSVLTGTNSFITPTPEQAAIRFKVDVTKCEQNVVRVQVYDSKIDAGGQPQYTLNIDSGCQIIQTNTNGEFYIANSNLGIGSSIDKAFVWTINPDKKTGTFNILANWNVVVTPRLYWSMTTTFK